MKAYVVFFHEPYESDSCETYYLNPYTAEKALKEAKEKERLYADNWMMGEIEIVEE